MQIVIPGDVIRYSDLSWSRRPRARHLMFGILFCVAGFTLPAMRPLHDLPTALMISNVLGGTDEVIGARVEVIAPPQHG